MSLGRRLLPKQTKEVWHSGDNTGPAGPHLHPVVTFWSFAGNLKRLLANRMLKYFLDLISSMPWAMRPSPSPSLTVKKRETTKGKTYVFTNLH